MEITANGKASGDLICDIKALKSHKISGLYNAEQFL